MRPLEDAEKQKDATTVCAEFDVAVIRGGETQCESGGWTSEVYHLLRWRSISRIAKAGILTPCDHGPAYTNQAADSTKMPNGFPRGWQFFLDIQGRGRLN